MSASLDRFPPVAFVTIRNHERAVSFYRDTLGIPLISVGLPFAVVFNLHGIMLRLSIDPESKPTGGTVLGWQVPQIVPAVEDLVHAGVAMERYSFLQQDDLGIWASPSGAKVAWFKDPDGNTLSVTQFPA